jgi:hypothetical protein
MDWSQDSRLGYAYDGQLALYTTKRLNFPQHTEEEISGLAEYGDVSKADELR